MFKYTVKIKCTVLLNWKHGRSGRNWALASARALHLTTYYHMPEYFGERTQSSNPEMEHSLKERLSVEFRWKLELFQKYGIRVRNHGVG